MGWRFTESGIIHLRKGLLSMNLQKLRNAALYVLQALLAIGAIFVSITILGGLLYLQEVSRHQLADLRSEVFDFLRTESVLVFVGTTLLFWIGTIRAYAARIRGAERSKGLMERPSLDPCQSSARPDPRTAARASC